MNPTCELIEVLKAAEQLQLKTTEARAALDHCLPQGDSLKSELAQAQNELATAMRKARQALRLEK